jgi:drug/metabolite transporter (DMT)-like permease
MKTAIVLIIAILAQTAGDVYLTKGMKAIVVEDAGLSRFLEIALQVAQSPSVLIGTALLILFFALYSAALSWADLSFVLPATAFGYVLNVAAGYYFLNETVSPIRWAGALIITLGVVFVSRSDERTAPLSEEQLNPATGGE